MKKFWFLTVFAFLSTLAIAQRPQVIGYVGGDLGDSVNYTIGVGVQENARHFIFDANGFYTDDRKSNDNTGTNPKGHGRSLQGLTFYKLDNGWFFGPGAEWSKEDTSNYSKQQWHGLVGGGKDFELSPKTTRIVVDYVFSPGVIGAEHVDTRGCTVPKGQCTSGLQGIQAQFWVPSPASPSHFFLRMTVGGWWGHETVTSTDPTLTKKQKSNGVLTSDFSITAGVRF